MYNLIIKYKKVFMNIIKQENYQSLSQHELIEVNKQNWEQQITKIKRGDVGFEVETISQGFTHKIIDIAQKAVSDGQSNIIHSFVVTKIDEEKKNIYVAEACQRGLVETIYHVEDYVKKSTQFIFYQDKCERFREINAQVAEQQVDKLKNGKEQNNNLYSLKGSIGSPFRRISYGNHAKKNLANACADFILNQPIRNSKNERKSLICSSLAAQTYQIAQLYESLGVSELAALKRLNKAEIADYLLSRMDSSNNIDSQKHAILKVDAKHIMPATLHQVLSRQP